MGYLFINYLSDNHGRKKIIRIAWSICTFGCALLAYAQNMWMASLGLFFCGMGADSAISITISIIVECYDNKMRQKHNIIIQASFLIGGLIMTGVFWKWKDWHLLALYVFFIPSAITLLMFFMFLK
jgi:MFS family permease